MIIVLLTPDLLMIPSAFLLSFEEAQTACY
jgi:hypothetical protein